MQAQAFAPQKERYSAATVTSTVGIVSGALVMLAGAKVISAAILLGAALLSWKQYQQGRARERGFDVEAEAVVQLNEQCKARGWRLQAELCFSGIGNLDAVVTTGRARYVIEIKSYNGLLAAGTMAVRANRARTPAHHEVRQVLRQVERIGGGVPVLWCPRSTLGSVQQAGRTVLVNGGVDMLCMAIANIERNSR